MDEIDRELASTLSIEASPEFRARVRERIAREPAPRSWYLQWRVVGVGAAAVAVAIALVLGRMDPTSNARKPGGPLTERRPLPSTALAGSPVSVLVPQTFGTAVLRPAPRVREPEVLMAPGEVRGLRQLEALVREGRAHFVFADEHDRTLSPEPVRDIVIAPIAIAPIEAAAVSESAGNSGGDEQ